MPSFFGALYRLAEGCRRLPFRSPVYFLNRLMIPVMDEYLREHHFDVVIMPHLFPAEIMTQMKNSGIDIPKTIFVATDYACTPFTEETECDAYVIPSDDLRGDFEKRGIPREKIYPLGIPVRSSFLTDISKARACESLGLDPDKKYLLISGGSIGVGKLYKIVEHLAGSSDADTRLIVICGNNTSLYNALRERYGDGMDILQTTTKIAEYMRLSELYFVKPGGLSSTEAAVMGIPLVHLPPIPGCETKNARFFKERGMNFIIKALRGDVNRALSLLNDEQSRKSMIEAQQKAVSRSASIDICALAENLSGINVLN